MSNKSKIYLPMAIIAAAALAIPAAAQVQVPFMGVFNGQDAVNTSVVPATITTTGVGTGTHLGQFSMTQVTLLTSQTVAADLVILLRLMGTASIRHSTHPPTSVPRRLVT